MGKKRKGPDSGSGETKPSPAKVAKKAGEGSQKKKPVKRKWRRPKPGGTEPKVSAAKIPQKAAEFSRNWKFLAKTLDVNVVRKRPHPSTKVEDTSERSSKAEVSVEGKPVLDKVRQGSKANLTRCIAMDCEMVGVGEVKTQRSVLARVSLVNERNECVYDKFVKPREKVVDFRTHVSGVTASHLKDAEDFTVVQKEVAELLKNRVLVGHALEHDLQVLFLSHPRKLMRDTARYSAFRNMFGGKTPSLRNLSRRLLAVTIQTGQHSSVQDAGAAMAIYKLYAKEWEASLRKRRIKKQPGKSHGS